jgi:hypothetical protein
MVPSGPRAWILLKEPGPRSDYSLVTHQAPLLSHREKRDITHLPSYPRRGCTGRGKPPDDPLHRAEARGLASHGYGGQTKVARIAPPNP